MTDDVKNLSLWRLVYNIQRLSPRIPSEAKDKLRELVEDGEIDVNTRLGYEILPEHEGIIYDNEAYFSKLERVNELYQ